MVRCKQMLTKMKSDYKYIRWFVRTLHTVGVLDRNEYVEMVYNLWDIYD